MNGLIFGLQCCNHTDKEGMLQEVMIRPIWGTLEQFRALWLIWSQNYKDLCGTAYIVIDQLQRQGDLFSALSEEVITCAGYILISSTGILHHHNVSSVYKKLTYFYPVSPSELTAIDERKTLSNCVGQLTTMLGAVSFMEDRNVQEIYANAARKHYETVKGKDQLRMLRYSLKSWEKLLKAASGKMCWIRTIFGLTKLKTLRLQTKNIWRS